jgi:hypothetical protein
VDHHPREPRSEGGRVMRRLYTLVLDIETEDQPDVYLDDAVREVVQWSTAGEAIATGLSADGPNVTVRSLRVDGPRCPCGGALDTRGGCDNIDLTEAEHDAAIAEWEADCG